MTILTEATLAQLGAAVALPGRRDRGIPAFSILSCDNIQGNGQVSQHVFTAFARLRDPRAGRLDRPGSPGCTVRS